jgi:hypothetical protein
MARLFLTIYGGAALFGLALTGCQTDNAGGNPDYVQEASEPAPIEGPGPPDPACAPDNPYC